MEPSEIRSYSILTYFTNVSNFKVRVCEQLEFVIPLTKKTVLNLKHSAMSGLFLLESVVSQITKISSDYSLRNH